MTDIRLEHADGQRVEKTGDHTPGSVKFKRLRNGNIGVTGNPDPRDVVKAIRRSKAKRQAERRKLGTNGALALKARLRRKLERLEG